MMFMVLSLSGLVNGLGRAVSSGVDNLHADLFVLSDDSEKLITVSNLTSDEVKDIEDAMPGDTTTLDIQRTYVKTAVSDEKKDAVYFAVDPNGFLTPGVYAGQTLADCDAENPVVLDDSFEQDDIKTGDTITDFQTGVELTVCGFSKDQMYGHVAVAFMPTDTYRQIAQQEAPQVPQSNHAVAVRSGAPDVDVEGTEVVSKADVIDSIPGCRAEQSTITMVIWMLVVITAVIIGIFFYVITIQKEKIFGTMKAIGMGMGRLMGFIRSQVLLIAVAGALFAALLTQLMAGALPVAMPFDLQAQPQAVILAAFVSISIAGGFASVWHVGRIDPAEIIGVTTDGDHAQHNGCRKSRQLEDRRKSRGGGGAIRGAGD